MMEALKKIFNAINGKFFYLKLTELFSDIIKKTLIRDIDFNLLVFGGDDFLGNTKYMFLYLNYFSNYRIVWLSRSKKVISNLRENHFEAYNRISIKSFILLLKARFIFITHGFNDILPLNLAAGTKLVYLAHGIPFKRLNFYAKNFKTIISTRYDIELMCKLFKNVDYHVSSSDAFNDILKNAFRISKKKIISIGYPRNDFLFVNNNHLIFEIKKKYNIPNPIKNIILYAPTFREDKIAEFPLNQQLFQELNDDLKKNNSILLLKAHKFNIISNFKVLDNIKVIPANQDIQELLLISNALITDYSGTFLDYLLTLNPIIFFAYDLERYQEVRGDFYFKYEDFVPGPIIKTGSELIKKIKSISEWAPAFEKKIKDVRNFTHKYKDGESCQRISNLLGLKLDLKKNKNNSQKWYEI